MTAEEQTTPKEFSSLTSVFRPFVDRGLSRETIEKYRVDVGNDEAPYLAKYPIFDINNNHIGNKVRYPLDAKGKKVFQSEGNLRGRKDKGLFGRHAFPPGSSKFITVVEGQDDAMAVHQMGGNKYPAVSVHSASTAEEDIRTDFEYLNSFETIVFCFDNDEAGQKAVKAAASVGFSLDKIKICTLQKYKDANDYLKNKASVDFMSEWWKATPYRPDELVFGTELWDTILERKDAFSVPMPFEGLNAKRCEVRLSEAIIVTADTGVGKTSFIKHIEHQLLTHPDVVEKGYGVGFLHFEEPKGDTALGLISVHNKQPYHLLPRDEWDLSLVKKAYDELLNNNRVVIWDHFGSNSVDVVLNKIRSMHALGCKYIIIDHLSIIVSDQNGDERKQLDEIATKLKTLTMELDIAVIAVIHTNRQGQIRGTAGVEQLANIVIRLERDKTEANEWRRNITKVTVEKNRFSGFTGPAAYLYYNANAATLTQLSEVDEKIFTSGGQLNDDQIPW